MHFSSTVNLCLLTTIITHFASLIHAESDVFSKFIGATTAIGPTTGPLSFPFSQCTSFIEGLPPLPDTSDIASVEMESSFVNIVCFACTGLGQKRIDSCCAQTASSSCFDQFTAAVTATTGPAATAAGHITSPGTAQSATAGAKTSSNGGGVMAQNMDMIAGSFVAGLVGVAALVL